MNKDLSIIIPAYNEGLLIENTIEKVYRLAKNLGRSFELIIANDGSTDDTFNIVNKKLRVYKELRMVSNKINEGRGSVLSKAFMAANGAYQIYLDADLAIDLELVSKFIKALDDSADIVIGSKHMHGAEIEYPPLRRIFSKSYALLVRLLLGSSIKDHQCGFKGIKKQVARKIIPKVKDKRWSWDTELLVKAQWDGYKIVELPAKVVNVYGRESKVHLIKDVKRMSIA